MFFVSPVNAGECERLAGEQLPKEAFGKIHTLHGDVGVEFTFPNLNEFAESDCIPNKPLAGLLPTVSQEYTLPAEARVELSIWKLVDNKHTELVQHVEFSKVRAWTKSEYKSLSVDLMQPSTVIREFDVQSISKGTGSKKGFLTLGNPYAGLNEESLELEVTTY